LVTGKVRGEKMAVSKMDKHGWGGERPIEKGGGKKKKIGFV